jgi:hypothetical protein
MPVLMATMIPVIRRAIKNDMKSANKARILKGGWEGMGMDSIYVINEQRLRGLVLYEMLLKQSSIWVSNSISELVARSEQSQCEGRYHAQEDDHNEQTVPRGDIAVAQKSVTETIDQVEEGVDV